MQNAINYSHTMLNELIEQFPNGLFIDATLGNGNDAIHILKHPKFTGTLLAFDIQPQALQTSQTKITQLNIAAHRYQLIGDSHANVDQYLAIDASLQGAIFNLGYLPKGNHQITTQADSTIQALEKMQGYLVKNGKIILVVYPGHQAGQIEKVRLLEELSQWPQETFQILQYQFINQINNPPFVIIIEKTI
ncbi:tRNA (mnm(5)s(2)U34)-methyltransferase [Fundicoccus culcitae]|uniref:Class I SAM-dependent methyltransferase n=1 Tax=Fundicoccus culcitae TaxID=2969821 RepID=A0ABY5P7C2_9LACT|nr:class I SAM-dependent methyltransferase [Fundicoccus culcitae]UUX34385.1 class I SAM-dependent methyltransferase [Fundicoccus culcitae]